MTRHVTIPPRDQVGPDDPLLLDVAAALAYPDKSMSGSGLLRQAALNRLAVERIGRKTYTTLRDIDEMRRLCRRAPKDQGSTSEENGGTRKAASPTPPSGSSATPDGQTQAQAAARMTLQALKESSKPISPASTSPKRRKGNVVHLRSRSRT